MSVQRKVLIALGVIAVISAVVVFGLYGVLAETSPTSAITPHTLDLAGQLIGGRDLAIALALLLALVLRRWAPLSWLLLMVGVIEASDFVVEAHAGQTGAAISPLLSGILYLICGGVLMRWVSAGVSRHDQAQPGRP